MRKFMTVLLCLVVLGIGACARMNDKQHARTVGELELDADLLPDQSRPRKKEAQSSKGE